MRRARAVLIVALALILLAHQSGSLPATPAVLHAQAAAACCVPLPAVATSKNPAPGTVFNELRLADLQAIFSNRAVMFAGGWDEAFTALAYEIDQTGRYGMRVKPAPRVTRTVGLEEGGVSQALLHPPTPNFTADQAPVRRNPATNRWARLGSGDARTIAQALVDTLARINKYGEPQQGLRDAALASMRFLADTLSSVPADVQRQDPGAAMIAATAREARIVLFGVVAIAALNPQRAALPGAARQGDLALTPFDRANAAFDVFRSVDPSGKPSGINRVTDLGDVQSFAQTLVALASGRGTFGGQAPPGSPWDSIACRAYSLLVELADPRAGGSETIRNVLGNEYGSLAASIGSPNGNASRLRAVTTAMLMAGVGSAQEARSVVEMVEHYGVIRPDVPAAYDQAIGMLEGLRTYPGEQGVGFRSALRDAVDERFDTLKKRIDVGGTEASSEEHRFFEAWSAGRRAATGITLNGACAAAPGPLKGRIILYAITADGLQVIEELYVGVASIVEVQFDDGKKEKDVPIELKVGGTTLKLTAKRFDEHGRIFRTDPIMPGGKPGAKEAR